MLSHTDLKKGTIFIYQGQPWQVLEYQHLKMAQRRPVVQTKIRNLITGSVQEKNFQQGDIFEEAEIIKKNIKFLYSSREQYFFCEENDPAKRFFFTEEKIGRQAKFLKPNSLVEGLVFEDTIINVSPTIKVHLKVTETPPGVKGDRAQGGTKEAILESGAKIQVPLFIEAGDIVEVNTESEEYVRRV